MNVLKWELRKRISRLGWILLLFAALFGVIYLLPVHGEHGFANKMVTILTIISMLVTIGSIYIVIVYPTLSMVIDLRSKYCVLEKMHSQAFIITAIIKTILNILTVLMGSGLLLLAVEMMKKFHTSNTKFLVLELKIPYQELIFHTAIFSPTIILFSCTVALSIPAFKRYSFVVTILLYIMIGGVILLMAYLPADLTLIVQSAAILLIFVVSCWLYDNKCEIINL